MITRFLKAVINAFFLIGIIGGILVFWHGTEITKIDEGVKWMVMGFYLQLSFGNFKGVI